MERKNMHENQTFQEHLYEPMRREIATHYLQHEMRKLLPHMRDEAFWRATDDEIARWYDTLSMKYFWNAVHGISMGFRLKSLVPWITSCHVAWSERELRLEEVSLGWKIGPSHQASEIQQWILAPDNTNALTEKRIALKAESAKSAPRDHFPIFVVRKEDALQVIDGNRRLLQAIVDDKTCLRAYVGEPIRTPVFQDHWVPTQILVDLVFWHKQHSVAGRDTTKTTAEMIVELIRDSAAGRHEFINTALHKDDSDHQRLRRAVEDKLESF